MRTGAGISGALHLGLIAAVIWGTDLFASRRPEPVPVGTVSLIDGAAFDAVLSQAPVAPSDAPDEPGPPADETEQPPRAATPEPADETPAQPQAVAATEPPEPRPDRPEIAIPPPPRDVPTEAPRPSIAEVPSPDLLDRQAATPESPPATEPLQPLATDSAPRPEPRPARPPDPEPEPEPEPQVAAAEPDETPEPEPEPKPTPQEQVQEPEEQPEPDEPEIADSAPDAQVSAAPQEARLPVARPARLAAAAPAASATNQPEPAAEPVETPEPQETRPAREQTQPSGGSASRFAQQVTRGEKAALRDGIKRFFSYGGNRSDRALAVVIAIELDPSGKIVGSPREIDGAGGPPGARSALFRAGRVALLQAANAGEFARLPAGKYESWRVIHVTFTPDDLGFQA